MNNKYSRSMRIIHWAMVALLLSMVAAGLTMVRSLEPWQLTLLTAHKGFGVLAAVLVVVRLVNRMFHKVPDLPQNMPQAQKLVAHASHIVMYILMLLLPVSGFLMQYFAGRPIDVFGLFRLPAAVEVAIKPFALFRELHGIFALLLVAVVCLHAAGALYHHWIKKDDVLKRML